MSENTNGVPPTNKPVNQSTNRRHMKQILLLFLLFCSFGIQAQTSPVLEDYIRTGLTSNLALQQQNLDLQKSLEAIRQSKALFLPGAQFVANYTVAAGGRSIAFPIGDILNPVYDNLNRLNEAMTPGAPKYPTDVENINEQFLPNNFHETKIKFTYPLYNTDLRYNKQIQEQLYQSKSAEKAAYEHELRYQITDAYLQYLRALEAEKIWINARSVLAELRRFNESLVRNNVATKDVVATADYELSKADNEIFKLRSNQNTARAYFNFLINKDLQNGVVADTTLLRAAVPVYQPQDLLQKAMTDRQEFNALRAGMNAAETNVKRNMANLKIPDFYIGGEAGFQGFGYTFGADQRYVLAQVGMTYDLFDGGKRKSQAQEARIEADKIRNQYAQAQQQISLQVTQAWNEYEAAQNSYKTAQTGLQAAEATFKIVNNKYRANQALLIEFLDAQNRVTTARLQALLAWSEVLIKEAGLRRAAGG
jgi:outer membrane protein